MTVPAFYTKLAAKETARLRAASLYRDIPDIEDGAAKILDCQGQKLINLASNNYLGLSGSKALIDAAVAATRRYGTGSGASRLVTGNCRPAGDLEAAIARLKGTEAALFLGSGYAANLAVLTALATRRSLIFADKLSHASLIDGAALSGARLIRFRHNDFEHLSALLEKHRDCQEKILVTESVFSMDGDIPDLAAFARLGREHGALTILDEAHATGIFGQGRGLAHEMGVAGDIGVQMGTMSKALGGSGGFLAASKDLIGLIRNRARSFIYSTAPPPAVCAAGLAALELVTAGPGPARRLLDLAATLRQGLAAMGFDTAGSASQIVPVILGDPGAALAAKEFLITRGFYAAAIRPPTVPAGTARLRLSLRADLTDADIEACLAAFREMGIGT